MSREAPPREAPAPALERPAPEREPHSAVWLMLPLVALCLPFAYRVATGTRVNRVFELGFRQRALGDVWLVCALVGALVLVGCMVARRRGHHVWAALDVVAGSLPWFVSLAAQSTSLRASPPFDDRDVPLWGLGEPEEALVATYYMHEARAIGALTAACLWAAAATVWLAARADRPHARGAALGIVTLPVWGVVYGFPAEAGPMPALAAAFFTGLVAFAGTQRSPEAREGARTAIVLGTLTVLAVWVATACYTVVGVQTVFQAGLLTKHRVVFDTLSAARLGALVALVPAALGMRWLVRPGDARVGGPANVALILAFVGVLGMDRVGTRLSLARATPDPWPPWASVDVTPVPVGDAWIDRGRRAARFILTDAGVLDPSGQLVARYADTEALSRALVSAPLAQQHDAPEVPGPVPNTSPRPGEVELGERMAIVALDVPAERRALCPGRALRVLVDRSLEMADLRTFVQVATEAGVVELDVVGPRALDADTKLTLQRALEASGLTGVLPLGGDELSYITALSALPATGVPAMDAVRLAVGGGTGLMPCACWRAQVWGTEDAEAVPTEGQEDDRALGEQLNEAPPEHDRWGLPPVPPAPLWLDPDRDVTSFVLQATSHQRDNRAFMWTLDPPAP
ncbi:MAG: hypothetical protein H6726_19010 [Sandaracinaceae bacterium]|nr:hypothetical protein [Sandaracinaceae bacterium]